MKTKLPSKITFVDSFSLSDEVHTLQLIWPMLLALIGTPILGWYCESGFGILFAPLLNTWLVAQLIHSIDSRKEIEEYGYSLCDYNCSACKYRYK